MKKILVTILKPAGNDTALVRGIPAVEEKKKINDFLMKKYPNVEQVGFYEYDVNNNIGMLEMAGGEFCGNATRSTAYVLLKGKPGKIQMQVSGTKQLLSAGINKENTAYAQMPIFTTFLSVRKVSPQVTIVEIEGITHLITNKPQNTGKEDLKQKGKKFMDDYNLATPYPAAGVMFLDKSSNEMRMDPIIWVRDIQTLFYETACASGATAVALAESLKQNRSIRDFRIKQPSNDYLSVSVEKTFNDFTSAYLDGAISVLKNETEEIYE